MRIGYICEDVAHAGVIEGALALLCPDMEIVRPEELYRGSIKRRISARKNNALDILSAHGASSFVVMKDSDKMAFASVVNDLEKSVPDNYKPFTYVAVPQPRIETWLARGDRNLLNALDIQSMPADPTHVKGALRGLGESRKERIANLAALVTMDAFKSWRQEKSCRKAFDNLKSFANRTGCEMEKVDL